MDKRHDDISIQGSVTVANGWMSMDENASRRRTRGEQLSDIFSPEIQSESIVAEQNYEENIVT